MNEQLLRVAKRFGKTFLAGGIAGFLLFAGANPVQDLNKWLVAACFAFITAGLLAIEKALQVPPK